MATSYNNPKLSLTQRLSPFVTVCLDIGFNDDLSLSRSSDGQECPAFELILFTTNACDDDDPCDCCSCAEASEDVCLAEGINILTNRFYS